MRDVTHADLAKDIGHVEGRLDAIETSRRDRAETVDEKFKGLEARLDRMDVKLDALVAVANMGRGAWWAVLKIGGALVVLAGAIGWLADRWSGIKKLLGL